MVLPGDLSVFSSVAERAKTLALVTAVPRSTAHGSAAIGRGLDVLVAWDHNPMLAAWYGPCDSCLANDRRRVLCLPAKRRAKSVAALQSQANIVQDNMTLFLAFFPIRTRARMFAAFFGPRALFQAFDRVMQYIRVASSKAGVAADESLVAEQNASALGRLLEEMVRPRHGKSSVRVSGALQL